jgi:hypothetical protein
MYLGAEVRLCKIHSRYRGTYDVCIVRRADGRILQLTMTRCR